MLEYGLPECKKLGNSWRQIWTSYCTFLSIACFHELLKIYLYWVKTQGPTQNWNIDVSMKGQIWQKNPANLKSSYCSPNCHYTAGCLVQNMKQNSCSRTAVNKCGRQLVQWFLWWPNFTKLWSFFFCLLSLLLGSVLIWALELNLKMKKVQRWEKQNPEKEKCPTHSHTLSFQGRIKGMLLRHSESVSKLINIDGMLESGGG